MGPDRAHQWVRQAARLANQHATKRPFLSLFLGALVAKARLKEPVSAAATQGSAAFNALYRVHQNTLERLVVFVPLLWMAGCVFAGATPVLAGLCRRSTSHCGIAPLVLTKRKAPV